MFFLLRSLRSSSYASSLQRTHMHLECRLLLSHKRVAIIGRRYEVFLDRSRAHPTKQVHHGTRFIVGSAGARSAERLLPNDSTRRLIVDIEIAGCKTKRPMRICNRSTIGREDSAG